MRFSRVVAELLVLGAQDVVHDGRCRGRGPGPSSEALHFFRAFLLWGVFLGLLLAAFSLAFSSAAFSASAHGVDGF